MDLTAPRISDFRGVDMTEHTIIRTYERDGIRVDVIREPDDRNPIVCFDVSWESAKPSRRRRNSSPDWAFIVNMVRMKADRDPRGRQTAVAEWG